MRLCNITRNDRLWLENRVDEFRLMIVPYRRTLDGSQLALTAKRSIVGSLFIARMSKGRPPKMLTTRNGANEWTNSNSVRHVKDSAYRSGGDNKIKTCNHISAGSLTKD